MVNSNLENVEENYNSDDTIITEFDTVINVSDEEIKETFDTLKLINDNVKNKTIKKTVGQKADEIVNAYLLDRSDKNWTKLQEFFWYGIKQFAKKYVGKNNEDDAYDMTIETFIRALENIDKYDPEKAKFSTWLWTICKNNCLYLINQREKMPTVDNDISDIYDSEMLSTSCAQDNSEYKLDENNILENISLDDVSTELYNVSIKEMHNIGGLAGQILEMKLVNNLKIREIADKLQMNESTVKNYLYKSKENLSRILKINHKELYNMYIDLNAANENII